MAKFIKNKPDDQIWWVDNLGEMVGAFEFSFDKKTVFNLFQDYPDKLTSEQRKLFDKENPELAKLFADRK